MLISKFFYRLSYILELLILVQCYNSATNTFQMAFLYFNVFSAKYLKVIDNQSCQSHSVIPNDNSQSNCKKDLNLYVTV